MNFHNQAGEMYFVYALLAEDPHGNGYIKIGRAANVFGRVTALKTACPFPIQYVAFVDVGTLSRGKLLEKMFHQALASRRTSGEWFSVDYSDPEDKAMFKAISQKMFGHFGTTMTKRSWTALSMEEMFVSHRMRAA